MMGAGLKATFRYLAKTENEAAVDVLVAGLQCPNEATRHGALRALLERPSREGHREVVRHLPNMDATCRAIIDERPERLVRAVSDALQGDDPQACSSTCEAIVSFRLYEALPALTAALVDPGRLTTALMADTVQKLTEAFYNELSGVDDQPKRKQQDLVRDRVTAALEDAVRKFHRHEQVEVVEAFLLVAKQKNVTLRQLLQRPDDSSHGAIVEVLSNSSQGGVIRLLLGFLEDPQMPNVVSNILCNRCDLKFVENFLRTVGSRPAKAIAESLARMDSIAWAKPGQKLLGELSEEGQRGVVYVLMGSSVGRSQALELIGDLLINGKPAARRAAAKALGQFQGPKAAALCVKALADEDAEVQASVLKQLRPRKIPSAFSLLIRMVDNPHPQVRHALREAMPEFTFRQFVTNFDSMLEALQPTAGHLVKKIDADAGTQLAKELDSQSPVRRRRALQVAGAMGLVGELEKHVIERLSDDDHMVRVAAAKVLADCKSMPSWEALRDAMLDRSVIVQEAAERSLEQISRSLVQHTGEEPTEEEVAPC